MAFVCGGGQKMWLLSLKMKAQIWGCLGQMAHRRQIAQWADTRTTHPGGTGFDPRPLGCVRPDSLKLGSACPHARRGFSRPQNSAPGFSTTLIDARWSVNGTLIDVN